MARLRWSNVVTIMSAHGWSWADVSRRTGLSQQQLCDLRKGRRRLTLDVADILCEALQISYDTLIQHPTVQAPITAKEVCALAEANAADWAQEYHRTQVVRPPRTEDQRAKKLAEELERMGTLPRRPLVKLYGGGI